MRKELKAMLVQQVLKAFKDLPDRKAQSVHVEKLAQPELPV